MSNILVVNPGATSTKVGVFHDDEIVFKQTIEHQGFELKKFIRVYDQFQYRINWILRTLEEHNIPLKSLNAVVGRGGLLKPIVSGTYLVNDRMLEDLRKAERGEHASNLGAVIADTIARQVGISAYVVDPVAVDELESEARISGMPELPRISLSHALNSKAVARKVAKDMGKKYSAVKFIVAHMGTGITVSCHKYGRMIDTNTAQDEGPFSPDRCGGLPAWSLAKLCYSGKYSEKELQRKILGSGGMYAYLGTKDIREVEKRASEGDKLADTVLNAMCYQVSKEIGAMSTVLCGEIDQIILTGGISYSERITETIRKRVKHLGPVIIVPGEEELEALAAGALRVLNNEEAPCIYK